MSGQRDDIQKETGDPQERLDSWKEIARYLDKGVTTVRRWEREEGLPVHRQEHLRRGSVVAYKHELEAWRQSRTTLPFQAEAEPWWKRKRVLVAVSVAVCSTGLVLWAAVTGSRPRGGEVARVIAVTSGPVFEGPPHLSSDGKRVVYAVKGSGGGIFVKPVDGGDARRIEGTWGAEEFPRWSPDAGRILFTRVDGAFEELIIASVNGGEAKRILQRDRPVFSTPIAAWEPDGRNLILVDHHGQDQSLSLYRLSLETGARKRLTSPGTLSVGDTSPASSPDGKRIAFARYHRGAEADLYVMPAEGGEPLRLTHDATYIHGIAWEPGGEHIVFHSNRLGASGRLWRIAADGAGAPELVPGVDRYATWPSVARVDDRLRIAFRWTRETVNIHRWDDPGLPGSSPRPVCPSNLSESAAHYSPDGTQIAFASNRGDAREIWVCKADGNGARQLTHFGGGYTDVPRWSPDGRSIAFTTAVNDNRDVYVIAATGGSPRRLTQEPSEEARPSWSRDGKWIWFRSNRSGTDQIWKTAAGGSGTPRQMTTGGGFESFEDLTGRWLYYCKDRKTPGLWRIAVDGGAEEQVASGVRDGLWSVAGDGLYFVRSSPSWQIWRQGFGEQEPKVVAPIPSPSAIWSGFSARFDGRSFLYSQTTSELADVVVVERIAE